MLGDWELRDDDGEAQGPFSEQEIITAIRTGLIDSDKPVRPVGKKRWRTLSSYEPFAQALYGTVSSPDEARPRTKKGRRRERAAVGAAADDFEQEAARVNPPRHATQGKRRGRQAEASSAKQEPEIQWRPPPPLGASIRAWLGRQSADTIMFYVGSFGALAMALLFANWVSDCRADMDRRQALEAQQARESRARLEQEARARDEAARQKKEEEARAAAELAAIEAARPPKERATSALKVLGEGGDMHWSVCRARELLDPIEKKDRAAPEVQRALSLLRVREAEQLQRERAAFEEHRGLMCRDGTMSPSCMCHGRHRGCCSHHKGVSGCEPLPTKITCP